MKIRRNPEKTVKAPRTRKFTAKDRADHDRLRQQIKEKLREERRARYEIAVLLAEVKERELWRIGGRGSFGAWVQANFGIKKRQANKYVAVRLGLTQEQVEGSRLCLDMQALIAGGRPALRGVLMALAEEPRADGKGLLPDGAIKQGLRAGEESLAGGEDEQRAVSAAQAAARSWQAAVPVGKGAVGKVEHMARLAAALRTTGIDGRRFALYCLIAAHLPGLEEMLINLSEKDLPPGIAELVRYYRNLLLNLS